MKKIIILIAVSTFAVLGCEKDPIIDSVSFSNLNKIQDSITVQPQSFPNVADSDIVNPLFNSNLTYGSITDIDGNIYKTIQIGNQVWMAENLRTTRYNDGSQIPNIVSGEEWKLDKKGAYCHYDNNPSNSEKFGLLYNYYAVATKKLAPEGWHVATSEDWENLSQKVSEYCGTLVDSVNWGGSYFISMKDVISVCNNSSGFTALPNGYRDFHWDCWIRNINGPVVFELLGSQACWLASNGVFYLDMCFGLWRGESKDLSVIGGGVRLVKD